MLISERIFELIKENGMTQKEFSMKTHIPQSTISDWKGKRLNPSSDKLPVICSVLGITPNDLLFDTEDEMPKSDSVLLKKNSNEFILVEAYRKMDDKSKEQIIQYVKMLMEIKE